MTFADLPPANPTRLDPTQTAERLPYLHLTNELAQLLEDSSVQVPAGPVQPPM